jgi:hypothetical protein
MSVRLKPSAIPRQEEYMYGPITTTYSVPPPPKTQSIPSDHDDDTTLLDDASILAAANQRAVEQLRQDVAKLMQQVAATRQEARGSAKPAVPMEEVEAKVRSICQQHVDSLQQKISLRDKLVSGQLTHLASNITKHKKRPRQTCANYALVGMLQFVMPLLCFLFVQRCADL